MPTLTLARGPSAVSSVAPITSTSLKARSVAIKSEVAALVAARSTISLAALRGDREAIEATAGIDKQRAALLSELETVEAAIPELQQLERTRPIELSGRVLATLKHRLRATVAERRQNLVFNLTHGSLRDKRENEIGGALAHIEPLTIAREIVQPTVRQVVAYDEKDRDRLTTERNRAVDKLAHELVEASELPPLPPEIARIQTE